jgi:V/A-type H+-transporting ATPase subunit I
MFRPIAMRKLNVLILSKFVTPVTRALGDLGVVHLVDATAQSREHLLERVDLDEEIRRAEQRLNRCESLLERIGLGPEDEEDEGPIETASARDGFDAELEAVAEEVDREQDAIAGLIEESGLLQQQFERLSRVPTQRVPLGALRNLSHLYIQAGRLAPDLVPTAQAVLGDRGILLYDPESPLRRGNVLIVCARKARWSIASELEKLGFREEELPEQLDGPPETERERIRSRLDEIRKQIEAARARVQKLALERGGVLLALRRRLRNTLALLRAQQRFARSAHLYCISGWAPRDNVERIRETVERVTNGTGIVEVLAPEEDEQVAAGREMVPVKLPGGRLRRPFEALVTGFGAPRYGELDPTLFVAISFVIMFGIMFGDIGQGAVLAIAGWWLSRTRRPWARPYRDAGVLLVFCGGSALVFGLLYGSIFGYENPEVLKPLWLSPLHDVTRLLKTTVVMGIVFLSLAIVFNIVNKLLCRRYFESVFDRFGVLGIIFYWGAIGIGLKAARAGELHTGGVLLVIVLPLLLLALREPLHNLVHRRRALEENAFLFFLEACIETMETLTGFLGNTVSFVRVGACALSHAALCLAIYSVMDILHGLPGGGLWSAVVLVLGNILVIALEGLVAMVQGVRLEYYELFSKYYSGDGVLYNPFSLGARQNQQGEQRA